MPLTPSSQQEAAIAAFVAGKSFGLKARAGSGKTSTIRMMFQAAKRPGLCLAFNKKNADELAAKIGSFGATASTLNSIGHRALSAARGRPTLDTKKFYQALDNLGLQGTREDIAALRDSVETARNYGYVPSGSHGRSFITEEALLDLIDSPLPLVERVLRESNRLAFRGLIDFTDQIYIPACFNIPIPKHPLVVIDEAQDLSATQHEIVRRCLADGGQLVVVGDPAQAIYGWRGALSSSYDDLITTHNLPILPLTVSFRCPKAVVAYARRYVDDFDAAPTNPTGSVTFTKPLDTIPAGHTYISRTNAPLIRMAHTLLRNGVIPNYLGRDFTTGLRLILKKHPTAADVDRWFATETAATRSPVKLQRLTDRYETLKALFQANNKSPASILDELRENPAGQVTLTTIHKAKGLEWPHTILNLKCAWQSDQDTNIAYVGVTRAQQSLQIVESEE